MRVNDLFANGFQLLVCGLVLGQANMTDRVRIVMRLENWALCQRGRGGGTMSARETRRTSPYGGQGYMCMTLVACNALRNAVNGAPPGKRALASMDFDDAALIQRAYQQLSIKHQLLLKSLYVYEQSVNAICRQLSIKHAPGHHWNRALAEAQDAIEDIVDGGNK